MRAIVGIAAIEMVKEDGALVQTIMIGGCDIGAKSSDELNALLVRRKAWFEKVAEAGLFLKILTTRDRAVHELPAEFDNPVLQAIHDQWAEQFYEAVQRCTVAEPPHDASILAPVTQRGG